ncbi:MAG TPA: hypothetical protein VMW36_04570 [Patescibacteria group bacterium]|nr:hypothetical protein [Patescibacteria group bacterium]
MTIPLTIVVEYWYRNGEVSKNKEVGKRLVVSELEELATLINAI